ncbi:hypothetical protein AD44_2781 [Escherichia coli 3-373-03_S4_C3]|nr:hypothetical protein CSC22_0192 [Escherichia coli]EFU99347.1 hypothetical protein EC3431_1066 [Escherichia coli 3431]EGW89623.1 hypothetical protein ECSTECEH250_4641 [Escherichia coli STEC_EH250]EGX01280.1 hypothetical protein ECG581_4383 [Escherichia coli G58-1]EHV51350.1 hypothetical protein ECDEC6B_4957 [Escherichia coli DEC6B]EHV54976.1 hypothetical protein ECDEC6C_4607 [Escherichia coli DEC6C]EKI22897.1 hypothetical protein ECTW00353_4338 [Escherichia coli TW00353]EKK38923.1 hypothet
MPWKLFACLWQAWDRWQAHHAGCDANASYPAYTVMMW